MASGDGDGHDTNATDPGAGADNELCPDSSTQVSSFHGSHVGGTIGASGNNAQGVSGVNWNVELMDVRVLGCGGVGSLQDVVDGIYYASGLPNRWGITPIRAADIINLSLGSPSYSQALAEAITAARNEGIIIIAAAGNNAMTGNVANYPASNIGVVSVAATNPDDARADYSAYNSMVDVAAPGGHGYNVTGSPSRRVYSAGGLISDGDIQSTYSFMSGTSMAAPHVSGIASLMKEIHPDLSPDDFDNAIASGMLSVDLGASGKDDSFGFGRIDGFKAAQTATSLALGSELIFAPQLSLNTTLINMGFSQTTGAFEILNLGGGDITVTSVSSDTPALSVQPANSAQGAGTYTITLDRQGLDSGVYSSYISVLSNAGPASLNIRYEVLPSGEEVNEDLGVMYTLLYNIASGNVEHSVASVAEEGEYPFFLEDVDPGVYAVISGTDIDNDGLICGNGESCAIWPSAADPEYLLVNRSLGELELGSYFVNQTTLSNLGGNASAPHKDIYHGSCDGFLISGVCASGVFNRGVVGDSQQPATGD